jgi:predicted nucleic acid-binding protein
MRVAAIESLVLDAAVALAWCFQDETTAYTESILDLVTSGRVAVVPSLWPYEVANVLALAERRRRATWASIRSFLHRVYSLPVRVDEGGMTTAFEQALSIARERQLSVYDAAYLELAIREGLPLATLDGDLRRAAKAIGVRLAGSSSPTLT